jgi:hypothetical protein
MRHGFQFDIFEIFNHPGWHKTSGWQRKTKISQRKNIVLIPCIPRFLKIFCEDQRLHLEFCWLDPEFHGLGVLKWASIGWILMCIGWVMPNHNCLWSNPPYPQEHQGKICPNPNCFWWNSQVGSVFVKSSEFPSGVEAPSYDLSIYLYLYLYL